MSLTTLLLAAALFGPSAPSAPPAPPQETSEATAEGIEILRRILAQTIEEALPQSDPAQEDGRFSFFDSSHEGLVTQLWGSERRVSRSRGFHLPGSGVLFTLDVEVPVVTSEPPAQPEKKTTSEHDDDWDKVKREVRSGQEPGATSWAGVYTGRARQPEHVELDPKAIDRIVEALLKTLARHAARIEGLTPQDSIIVALQLSGGGEAAVWTTSEPRLAPGKGLLDDGEPEDDTDAGHAVRVYGNVLNLIGRQQPPEQHLVLRVSLADLTAEGGLARLTPRVKINRY